MPTNFAALSWFSLHACVPRHDGDSVIEGPCAVHRWCERRLLSDCVLWALVLNVERLNDRWKPLERPGYTITSCPGEAYRWGGGRVECKGVGGQQGGYVEDGTGNPLPNLLPT